MFKRNNLDHLLSRSASRHVALASALGIVAASGLADASTSICTSFDGQELCLDLSAAIRCQSEGIQTVTSVIFDHMTESWHLFNDDRLIRSAKCEQSESDLNCRYGLSVFTLGLVWMERTERQGELRLSGVQGLALPPAFFRMTCTGREAL